MGTNVVRLTDRKYMQELQRRIQEDYNVTLEKRISEREVSEDPGTLGSPLCTSTFDRAICANEGCLFVEHLTYIRSNGRFVTVV